MCVVLHWNPLPLLFFILFTSAALAVTALISLLFFIYKSRSENQLHGRRSRPVSIRTASLPRLFFSKLLFPFTWTSEMVTKTSSSVYLAIRRTLHNAANVVRWRTTQHSIFDHEQLIQDSRWEKFWRERVIPASEEATRAGIQLENFPIVRQTQMGTIIAYSVEYIRDMFARKVQDRSVTEPRERYVLLLRGPKTESETELEPKFKDVVTDMLQFKQVTCFFVFLFLIDGLDELQLGGESFCEIWLSLGTWAKVISDDRAPCKIYIYAIVP